MLISAKKKNFTVYEVKKKTLFCANQAMCFILLYFNICASRLYNLYNVPTNAQLNSNLLCSSTLHCPYVFRRHCFMLHSDIYVTQQVLTTRSLKMTQQRRNMQGQCNIEQYNKLLINCAFVVHYINTNRHCVFLIIPNVNANRHVFISSHS